MAKPRVLAGANMPAQARLFLESFCECEYCDAGTLTREDFLGRLKDKEGVLIFGTPVDREFLDAAPRLRAVCNVSVGYNNVDLAETGKRGIIVTNTPGVLDETVADLILSLMLSSSRRIVELDGYVRSGLWKKTDGDRLYGLDIHHTTLGIIGMGRIGEAVARRAAAGFSMDVLYFNRNRKREAEQKLGVTYRDLEDLLKESDFIVLMTPLTEETRRMIGRREFSLMKETAFFINASRGQTVDEEALIEALEAGSIAGAGLDVFDREPVSPDNPLLKLPNTVLVPHIGSATHRTRDAMAMLAAENLKGILEKGTALTPV